MAFLLPAVTFLIPTVAFLMSDLAFLLPAVAVLLPALTVLLPTVAGTALLSLEFWRCCLSILPPLGDPPFCGAATCLSCRHPVTSRLELLPPTPNSSLCCCCRLFSGATIWLF